MFGGESLFGRGLLVREANIVEAKVRRRPPIVAGVRVMTIPGAKCQSGMSSNEMHIFFHS